MGRWLFVFGLVVVPMWLNTGLLGHSLWWSIGGFALGIAGTLLVVAVHELGHAVVGTRQGLRLRWLAVGPMMVDVAVRWRVRRSPVGGAVGGFAAFDLGELSDAELIPRLRRMNASGPIANLLLALVCLGVGFGVERLPADVAMPFVLTGMLSALLAVTNALPIRVGSLRSDGCTFLILLRGGAGAESLVRGMRLAQVVWTPERPADWPEALVTQLEETVARTEPPPATELDEWLNAAYLLYLHYVDRGLYGGARAILRLIAMPPRDPRLVKRGRYDVMNVMSAVHLALWDGDAVTAEALLARVPKQSMMRRNTLWLGAEAAIQFARGNAAAALKQARRAQRRLAPFLDLAGANELERTWWEALIARAEAALAGQPDAGTPVPALVTASAGRAETTPDGGFGRRSGGNSPGQAMAWSLYALPGDIRWLHRTPSLAARPPRRLKTVAPPKPVAPPLPVAPVVVRPKPTAMARDRDASVPVALLKALAALAALLIAMTTFAVFVTGTGIAVLGEEREAVAGLAGIAAVLAVDLGLAVWLWRQAGSRWGVPGFFFLGVVFPLYVYKQNRGMTSRATRERVAAFPTMATVGVLLLTCVLLFGVMVGIAYHREGEEPEFRPERPSMVL